MATGFGLTQITFTAGTEARAEDVNANFTQLTSASAFNFATCQVDPALTPDTTFRGMKMLNGTDFGILNNTTNNPLRFATGNSFNSPIVFCDESLVGSHRFWTDGSYDYLDALHSYFRIRIGTTNALRLAAGNSFTISSTNYGFITAANGIFGQGSGNADIAEPMLTEGDVKPGMAVCCSSSDTVSPCTHPACRVAKIVSTSPTMLLMARVEGEDMTAIEGHETAMPIVIGGAVPVLMLYPQGVRLRDRVTSSGYAGLLKVASEQEYALGDVVKIENGVVYAWIHY